MTTDARTKTAEEMVASTPEVLGMLLMRFERDARALSDYLLRDEQDKLLKNIQYTTRNWLMFVHAWSHEAATALSLKYQELLVMRLARPHFFKTPSAIVRR